MDESADKSAPNLADLIDVSDIGSPTKLATGLRKSRLESLLSSGTTLDQGRAQDLINGHILAAFGEDNYRGLDSIEIQRNFSDVVVVRATFRPKEKE